METIQQVKSNDIQSEWVLTWAFSDLFLELLSTIFRLSSDSGATQAQLELVHEILPAQGFEGQHEVVDSWERFDKTPKLFRSRAQLLSGWWFEPFWKILVNWDDNRNPIFLGKLKIDGNQTTNQL